MTDQSPSKVVLFDGAKTIWKTKTNLNVILVAHADFNIIEIIAYNQKLGAEAPRLYIRHSWAVSKLNRGPIMTKLKEEREILIRQRKTVDEAAILQRLTEEALVESVLMRINISTTPSDDEVFEIVLQPTYEDIVDEENGLIDFMVTKPPDLNPHFIKRKMQRTYTYFNRELVKLEQDTEELGNNVETATTYIAESEATFEAAMKMESDAEQLQDDSEADSDAPVERRRMSHRETLNPSSVQRNQQKGTHYFGYVSKRNNAEDSTAPAAADGSVDGDSGSNSAVASLDGKQSPDGRTTGHRKQSVAVQSSDHRRMSYLPPSGRKQSTLPTVTAAAVAACAGEEGRVVDKPAAAPRRMTFAQSSRDFERPHSASSKPSSSTSGGRRSTTHNRPGSAGLRSLEGSDSEPADQSSVESSAKQTRGKQQRQRNKRKTVSHSTSNHSLTDLHRKAASKKRSAQPSETTPKTTSPTAVNTRMRRKSFDALTLTAADTISRRMSSPTNSTITAGELARIVPTRFRSINNAEHSISPVEANKLVESPTNNTYDVEESQMDSAIDMGRKLMHSPIVEGTTEDGATCTVEDVVHGMVTSVLTRPETETLFKHLRDNSPVDGDNDNNANDINGTSVDEAVYATATGHSVVDHMMDTDHNHDCGVTREGTLNISLTVSIPDSSGEGTNRPTSVSYRGVKDSPPVEPESPPQEKVQETVNTTDAVPELNSPAFSDSVTIALEGQSMLVASQSQQLSDIHTPMVCLQEQQREEEEYILQPRQTGRIRPQKNKIQQQQYATKANVLRDVRTSVVPPIAIDHRKPADDTSNLSANIKTMLKYLAPSKTELAATAYKYSKYDKSASGPEVFHPIVYDNTQQYAAVNDSIRNQQEKLTSIATNQHMQYVPEYAALNGTYTYLTATAAAYDGFDEATHTHQNRANRPQSAPNAHRGNALRPYGKLVQVDRRTEVERYYTQILTQQYQALQTLPKVASNPALRPVSASATYSGAGTLRRKAHHHHKSVSNLSNDAITAATRLNTLSLNGNQVPATARINRPQSGNAMQQRIKTSKSTPQLERPESPSVSPEHHTPAPETKTETQIIHDQESGTPPPVTEIEVVPAASQTLLKSLSEETEWVPPPSTVKARFSDDFSGTTITANQFTTVMNKNRISPRSSSFIASVTRQRPTSALRGGIASTLVVSSDVIVAVSAPKEQRTVPTVQLMLFANGTESGEKATSGKTRPKTAGASRPYSGRPGSAKVNKLSDLLPSPPLSRQQQQQQQQQQQSSQFQQFSHGRNRNKVDAVLSISGGQKGIVYKT